ncbi:hypothetical protein EDS67_09805 [candidate division KSB1 bacterium]|nr:MAG: hypothetical protein EDS67_09805 [candidate division KSB1 bacterium]MBC6950207.1 hypothetical protein [candidate division KSB1 bacterium]MCE7941575.1 hypothetical protein [Chlorobi bacterium CHB1]MDL1875877.1 hypothetical protein [Cytophagia bacterium CHB2]
MSTLSGAPVQGQTVPENGGSAAAQAQTPEEKRSELERNLTKLDKDLQRLNQLNKTWKGDFALLDALIKELKKILDAYEKARPKLSEDWSARDSYARIQEPMLKEAVKENEPAILKIIDDWGGKETECTRELADAEKAKDDADQALAAAQKDLAAATAEFEKTKLHQKRIEDDLKKLAELQKQIEKEEEGGKYAVMYYLLLYDYIIIKDGSKVPVETTREMLEQDLVAKWQAMDTALRVMRFKEKQQKEAAEKYDTKKKECEQLSASKRAKILEELAKFQF